MRVDCRGDPLSHRFDRLRRDANDLDAHLREAIELAAQGVELAVGGDDPGALLQRQCGEKPHHELVRVGAQRDVALEIFEQRGEATCYAVGFGEGAIPLVVHQLGGGEPGTLLGREADVGPRLMRVPGQQEAPLTLKRL